MRYPLRITLILAAVTIAVLSIFTFERLPVDSVQRGYRGLSVGQVINPRTEAVRFAANELPEVLDTVDPNNEKASVAYQNVQVLGDLDSANFNRLMQAITSWVAPEQGCAYCHNVENMASDEVYTKGVTRRMLQMTRHINESWSSHVQQTGVTCYTCHRGNPVPQYVWAESPETHAWRGLTRPTGQNLASKNVGSSSLPYDPYTPYLQGDSPIRVIGTTAKPQEGGAPTMDAEWTYGLMMHFSQSLGVNCTYCHNSRAFAQWEQGNAAQVNAWYGIRMVRSINNAYITPLTPVWAANPNGPADGPVQPRLGHLGDALKVNCTTCHQGVFKPLYAAPMLRDYPELSQVRLSN